MRFWWVNQNQTYKTEVQGGFMWSPKVRTDGARNQFYENMREVAAGDIVFSFCDTYIKAIGRAIGAAESSLKPGTFGNAGAAWADEGWLVRVEFQPLKVKVRPKDNIELLAPYLPKKYSPLQKNGNGLQSVYLAEIPQEIAMILGELIGSEFESFFSNVSMDAANDDADEKAETAIKGRTDIGPTKKAQLIQARVGQGLFKSNVRLNESACRITGVSDPQHLRASHIRPWKDCSDDEKLDGCNGLLLAPHIDHLFDRGFISFSDDGDLLISDTLDVSILGSWGIPVKLNVGRFNSGQTVFLKYHRSKVFKKSSELGAEKLVAMN